jgi:hypothetical protein
MNMLNELVLQVLRDFEPVNCLEIDTLFGNATTSAGLRENFVLHVIYSDRRVKKIRHNEIMFAPFAHIKGCLFTLYNLAFGYTTYIMTRFHLSNYLKLVAHNKVESS